MVNWYDLYPCNYNQDVKKILFSCLDFFLNLKKIFIRSRKQKIMRIINMHIVFYSFLGNIEGRQRRRKENEKLVCTKAN
jgi:hypothetical protein